MYTDGIVEAMDASGEQFGMERVHHILREKRDAPAREIVVDRYGLDGAPPRTIAELARERGRSRREIRRRLREATIALRARVREAEPGT